MMRAREAGSQKPQIEDRTERRVKRRRVRESQHQLRMTHRNGVRRQRRTHPRIVINQRTTRNLKKRVLR